MNGLAVTSPITTALSGIALGALAVAVIALAYLHASPTGLSPVRNVVSQYGITSFRLGYRVQTIAFGVSGAALAIALASTFHGHGRVEVLLLVVFALARGVISWFPMDEPGTPFTPTGRRHGLLALVTFLSIIAAAARFSSLVHAQNHWHKVGTLSIILAVVMAASFVAMMATRSSAQLRRYVGALERVLYLAMIAWLGVVEVACLVQAR